MIRYLPILVFSMILGNYILFPLYSIGATSTADQVVYKAQVKFKALGYRPGPTDGIFGKRTRAATVNFQKDQGLPLTGILDTKTQSQLGILSPPITTNHTSSQITPPETIGRCLSSHDLVREYQKDTDQFNERFTEVPLCVSGYPSLLGEEPEYFYINISTNVANSRTLESSLNLQCRIEKLNELHRNILKQSLNINTEEKIQVKGIYKSTTTTAGKTLILDQCYMLQTAGNNN